MSREDWIAIASRLFALYLAVTLLRSVPPAVAFLEQADLQQAGSTGSYIPTAVVLLSGAVLCVLLWVFPLTIARRLLPVMKQPRSELRIDPSTALSLGLTLVGVWMLATTIPDTIYWAAFVYAITHMPGRDLALEPDQRAAIWATAAEWVLALCLIFGSTGIRRLIEHWRFAGKRATGLDEDRGAE